MRRLTIDASRVTAPVVGGGVATLTLDPFLQRAATRLLKRAGPLAGAIVLVEAHTGRLLVWAEQGRAGQSARRAATANEAGQSARRAATANEAGQSARRAATANETGKRRDRALAASLAPAASLFKLATTAALLEQKVGPSLSVCISGGEHGIERRHLRAARDPESSCAPFSQALGYSRNAAYAQLATRYLTHDALVAVAHRLGFGEPVPLDVPAPLGTVELPRDPLHFARAAAGFEGSTLSVLGAAHLVQTIALSGQPTRLRVIESAPGYEAPRRRERLPRKLDEPVAYELRRMMELTVHAGTALDAFTSENGRSYLAAIRVAAKTGTLHPSPAAPTTTWFAGFAPSGNPRVVLSVLIQNGPSWRQRAKEVARDMLRVYFARRGARGVTDPFEEPLVPSDADQKTASAE